jgi:magnesium-transporting ATPase (P-type)
VAVEDRLQSHITESIQWISDAVIRKWVLAGHKLETAIEFG